MSEAALRDALKAIVRGSTSVLVDAALNECPINPDVLAQIVKDATGALTATTASANKDIFDLLEAVAEGLDSSGHKDASHRLRAGFSRMTGGVDYEWLGQFLAPPLGKGEA